jgi:xanthine dehydrogenase accessory factor
LIDFPLTCFSGGTLEIFIEPQYPQPRLLVIGSLPVARALVSLGRVMHYDVIAVDPDGDNHSQADGAPVVTALTDIGLHVRPDTYAVVATHGNFDEAALEPLLKARPRYIGLVASRKRFQAVLNYLRAQGIDEADLERIKAPAGLDIQAQGGDEIAVSILAEIIQYRRNNQATDWDAPATTDEPTEPAMPTTPEMATETASGTAIDPVCLMDVDIATARYTYDYEGKTYYFCAPGCKLAFRRNPEEYLHPTVAIDPVCGMEVQTASAQYSSEYRGKTFYFCGEGCKVTFDQNPEAYVTVMHHH